MSPAHLNSVEITRKPLAGEPFTARNLLRLINRQNAPAAIALYLKHNLKPLKRSLGAQSH